MRVFFSTAEPSAETIALKLIEQLNKRAQEEGISISIEGIGGKRFQKSDAHIIADSSGWSIMGFSQALITGLRILRGYRKAQKALATGKPGLFIPIDFGGMNVRLAEYAKMHGWKVLYIMPPGSWRRDRQGRNMAQITDAIVTPFKWSADLLTQAGTNVFWFGHPSSQIIAENPALTEQEYTRIAFLPGSRHFEIKHNMKPVSRVFSNRLGYPIEFALAPTAPLEYIQKRWLKLTGTKNEDPILKTIFTQGETFNVLNRAQAGIICSGTATLEAALLKCPMVVIYRGPKIMELEYFIRRPEIKFISLPNIILNRKAVPELIQWEATPEKIRKELDPLLTKGEEWQKQLEAFDEINELLGPKDAITQTSYVAINLIKEILRL